MKPCKEFENKIPLSVSGDLSDDERRRMTTHLQNCPACRDYHSALAAIIDTMKQEPEIEPPASYGAELVIALNNRLVKRRKNQRRALWAIPAFASLAAFLIIIASSLFKPGDNRWFEQFNQEHMYVNFSSVGYFGEFVPADDDADPDLSTDEIVKNAIYQMVEEERLYPEVERCVIATASLDDAEFRQLVYQMKREIL